MVTVKDAAWKKARSESAKKAIEAMRSIGEYAKQTGLSEMTLEEINEEIAEVRREIREERERARCRA